MAKGGNVEMVDRSVDTIKAMQSLAKKGLRQAGKILKKQALENMTPDQKKKFGKMITYKATVSRSTGQPYGEAGYISKSHKRHAKAQGAIAFMPNPSWLEFGTKPHVITAGTKRGKPTGKRTLSNSHIGFGARVKHPGSKGYKPLTRAGESKAKEMQEAILPFLQQIAEMGNDALQREADSYLEELDEE